MEKELEQQVIYGRNAVAEALASDKEIDIVFISKTASVGNIVALAKKRGVVVKVVSDEKLAALSNGAKHGGVCAELCAAEYSSVEDILENAARNNRPPFIIIADEIADPHNLGAIIRTAEAAGAAAWVKVARVSNLTETIKTLKKNNVWVYGMEADGTPYEKTDFTAGTAIVVGSEGFGLGRLVRENCDEVLSLPMNGKVNSLNASVSAGILMYEVVRQRNAKAQGGK